MIILAIFVLIIAITKMQFWKGLFYSCKFSEINEENE